MSNHRVKSKTYVVLVNEYINGVVCTSRYSVGAKNKAEAEIILKNKIGKHKKVRTYFEKEINSLKYGEVLKEKGV